VAVDFFQELKDLLDALEGGAIEYALCGGVALAIHGVPRATQDIDLLVRPEDLDRLREVVRRCGFLLESFPMDFASGITIQRFTKLIDGQPLMLDALLVNGPLAGAWERRQVAEVEGGRVRVIARGDLIALKLAAGRPQDLVDVQRLQEAGRG
jgi:Nucleotidyl transferase AbiEii toxin, Type IV TA system